MEKEEFVKIMKEYGFTDEVINLAWEKMSGDGLNEKEIRDFAKLLKDILQ